MASNVTAWRQARLRHSDDAVRWRLLVELPALSVGLDERGRWVRFLPGSDELIALVPGNELFLLPLLDLDYAEVERTFSVVAARDCSCPPWTSLLQPLVGFALRERSPSYIERALRWLAQLELDEGTYEALQALSRSKRGTQQQRQSALALVRRHQRRCREAPPQSETTGSRSSATDEAIKLSPPEPMPSRAEVASRLRALLAGTATRDEVVTWASTWVTRDERHIDDRPTWEVLLNLAKADLVAVERPHLFGKEDLETWLADLLK